MKPYSALQQRLGYTFRQLDRLINALTHASFRNNHPESIGDNQRLEFLGDAVLNMLLADVLYQQFPDASEGFLAHTRATLACGTTLITLAEELQLAVALRFDELSLVKVTPAMLEDALEAVIGAIYEDSDYRTVRKVVLGWYGDLQQRLVEALKTFNPQGMLQEWVQREQPASQLHYSVCQGTGPDHCKRFVAEVRLAEQLLGRGEGSSKKWAKSAAAQQALAQLAPGLMGK